MGCCLASAHRDARKQFRAFVLRSLLMSLGLLLCGCRILHPVNTQPLDAAGMSYDAVQELKSLRITATEVAQIARARQSGFSDADCVDAYKIFGDRKQLFDAGDAIASLVQVNVSDDAILELARINQLGLDSGEFQAMKLAGLSDDIILEVARHRAHGQPVLSGASLARLKNTGMRASTLFELARRGVPDSQGPAIISYRRHGASDDEVLRRFAGI